MITKALALAKRPLLSTIRAIPSRNSATYVGPRTVHVSVAVSTTTANPKIFNFNSYRTHYFVYTQLLSLLAIVIRLTLS